MILGGPQAAERSQRRSRVKRIAESLQRHFGDRLIALGVYGSVAQDTDGPFSDIEMHCVVKGESVDACLEWSTGPWKAEVDVYTPEVILAQAAEVDVDWPVTHACFTRVWRLYDPEAFFDRLAQQVLSQPEETFRKAILDVIVGEIYELLGKVRNCRAAGAHASLPLYAVLLARYGACLVALENRFLFTSASRIFEESLALPGRPPGYDDLCNLVTSGKLDRAFGLFSACDTFWDGVESWAVQRGYPLQAELKDLLLDLEA